MSVSQYVVTAVGLAAIVWVLWYFLLSKGSATEAPTAAGVQEVRVVVKGGYTPDTIVVRVGQPVRLQFYRDETADCSDRVVFEDFGIDTVMVELAAETSIIEKTLSTPPTSLPPDILPPSLNDPKYTIKFLVADALPNVTNPTHRVVVAPSSLDDAMDRVT